MPKQKQLLSKILELHLVSNKEFQAKMKQYERVMASEEWKFVRDTFLIMRSEMIQDLFSKKFTEASTVEKDILQRTYYGINEAIEFLIQPTKWLKKRMRFKIHEVQSQAKAKLASKGK